MNFRTAIQTASLALAATLALPASAADPVEDFVQAFNRAERPALTAYVQQNYSAQALQERSAEERVDELLNAHQQLGAIAFQEVSGVSRVSVINVRSSHLVQDADIVLLRDANLPHQITDIYIHPVEPDAVLTAEASR
ncbi:hypothetical protein D0B54_16250 [Solimonas sp. K1W22B-7]|uniref:hypothetical protein n=1 Tax=Solimonas sp. K1W22B-7 TaxID=2303331 RepID=UPI000E32DBAA|nr:hypothetical protein [Solimonas sp. K1W22B-7]AXQ30127.1 hypothetical protein D0B54_16250 [Solimonas sp. K1W22B-7]